MLSAVRETRVLAIYLWVSLLPNELPSRSRDAATPGVRSRRTVESSREASSGELSFEQKGLQTEKSRCAACEKDISLMDADFEHFMQQ